MKIIHNTTTILKPCRFCGGKANMFIELDGKSYSDCADLYIQCEKCGIRTDIISPSRSFDAVEASVICIWNRED